MCWYFIPANGVNVNAVVSPTGLIIVNIVFIVVVCNKDNDVIWFVPVALPTIIHNRITHYNKKF